MSESAKPNTASLTLMGIVLIVFGVLAIGTPAVAGAAVVYVIGAVLLVAGIVQIVSGLKVEGFTHKLPPIILGILAALCGIGVLGHTLLSLTFLALLMAIFFVVEGVWKIIASFSYRPASGWVFMLFSGVIGLLLGLMIWQQWPLSGLWAVGILVGVDLIVTGVSMIAVASTIRSMQKMPAGTTAPSTPGQSMA